MAKLQDGNDGRTTSEIFDRVPPQDLQAEMALLGSIFHCPERLDDISTVNGDDFYDGAHGEVYNTLREMHDAGRKIDSTLFVSELKRRSSLEIVGGTPYLAKLISAVPNASHAVYYAKTVKRLSVLRQLITTGGEIVRDAFDTSEESDVLLDRAEAHLYSIRDKWDDAAPVHVKTTLREALERLSNRLDKGVIEGTIRTGYVDLDKTTGGFRDSELTIIAARPSMGKTAFAMNLMQNVAGYGHAVAFFSLEMSGEELTDRLLVAASKVNSHRLRSATLGNDERNRIVATAGEISNLPIFIDEMACQTVNRIAGQVRRLRRKHDIRLVIIDYLQLIEPADHKSPRQEQVSQITRRLKLLAKEFKVPVVCLCQLNRQGETTSDHIPKLSHLRESGAIEQDADNVWFVHREEYFLRGKDAEEAAGKAEIVVAKQRNGPTESVHLVWRKEFMRFDDKAPERLSVFDRFNHEDQFPEEEDI